MRLAVVVMLRSLHSVINDNRVRYFSAIIQIASQNVGEKHDEGSQMQPYCKVTLCVVAEKNWKTKEDKGSTMMLAM